MKKKNKEKRKENENFVIQQYESRPVSLVLPDHVVFEVIESDAVIKGQTAASSYKPSVTRPHSL